MEEYKYLRSYEILDDILIAQVSEDFLKKMMALLKEEFQ